MAVLNFNARTVDPSSGFDPLPNGWYNARIIESEIKPTNAGDGSYLAVTWEVIDGQYANRRVFQNFNLENKNPVAVKIAYEQMSALAYCAGVLDVTDSTMLHGIPLQIKLVEKPAGSNPQTGKTWEAGNDVKDFRNAAGQSAKEILATFTLPVPSGSKVGDVFDSLPVFSIWDNWDWNVTTLTGTGTPTLRLSCVGVGV